MGSILVILSAFGFSTLGLFGKFAYAAGFTRNQSLMWRFGVALPFLFLILRFKKSLPDFKDEIQRNNFGKAVALGFIGIGVEASLYFMTMERVGVAMTGIFLYLYPTFVALISYVVLKEKLSAVKWFCVLLALIGCFFTCYFSEGFQASQAIGGPSIGIQNPANVAIGFAMALWYSIYLLIGNRVIKEANPLMVGSGVVLGAFLCFAMLSGFEILQSLHNTKALASSVAVDDAIVWQWPESTQAQIAVWGLALFATVLPFTTLYTGMKRVGATRTAILSTLEMVFTVILAAMFLGEKLTLWQGFGATLILLSVLLMQKVR
jgi:drug/metabolite transporter (DMT)-like permease